MKDEVGGCRPPTMMSLQEAAQVLHAERFGDDADFTHVTTDSRTAQTGDLFVALRGERFDGHRFIAQARAQGAVAALVQQADAASDFPLLVVEDTRRALGELAAHWRSRFAVPLVAVTGSNGKTTVKEMLAAILRAACAGRDEVLASAGNLNNDIGVPLTLLELRARHRYAVIEMGMNHPGEIRHLAALAAPDVALVNNAAAAHLAGLGTVAAVAHAKGEIFEGLRPDGIAVINADDAFAPLWRDLARGRRIVDFGLGRATVSASFSLTRRGSRLRLSLPQGESAVELQVPGEHNVRNALAAAAAATALNVDTAAIVTGLAEFAGVKGRLQRKTCGAGATLLDDTYNANPQSVRAAIQVLAACPGEKILVLGDMGELGEEARALHAEIGAEAKRAGINALFALGDLSAAAAGRFGQGARHFERIEDLLAELESRLAPQATVLVKGSRFMQMEKVVEALAGENR